MTQAAIDYLRDVLIYLNRILATGQGLMGPIQWGVKSGHCHTKKKKRGRSVGHNWNHNPLGIEWAAFKSIVIFWEQWRQETVSDQPKALVLSIMLK